MSIHQFKIFLHLKSSVYSSSPLSPRKISNNIHVVSLCKHAIHDHSDTIISVGINIQSELSKKQQQNNYTDIINNSSYSGKMVRISKLQLISHSQYGKG
jgi:hypothetical protein